MKKFISSLVVLATVFSLSGCERRTALDCYELPTQPAAAPKTASAISSLSALELANRGIERFVDKDAGVLCYARNAALACVPLSLTYIRRDGGVSSD